MEEGGAVRVGYSGRLAITLPRLVEGTGKFQKRGYLSWFYILGVTGIERGDPELLGERITCAKGSEDLKKCGSRVGLGNGEAEKVGWNHILKGLEQQAEEPASSCWQWAPLQHLGQG